MNTRHHWTRSKGTDVDGVDFEYWDLRDVDDVDVIVVERRDGEGVLEDGQRGYPMSRRFHTLEEARAVANEILALDSLFNDDDLHALWCEAA